jgi:L-alanine-DL-glutamate epimerase-like enolase superfamily enzyme
MGLIHPHAPASHDEHLFKDGYRDALDVIDEKGHVPVPQGPGLGVEIDWDYVAKNRTGMVVYE